MRDSMPGRRAYTQQLLMLQGQLTVFVGEKRFDLAEGDCLDFDVMRKTQAM